jgi:hypothetical protein
VTAPPRPTGWTYYAAVVLFIAVLAFAVLGLVRSSTVAEFPSAAAAQETTPSVTPGAARQGPVPTAQIPPPTRSAPTRPPSRTYLHPPPELAATPGPEGAAQPRR